LIDLRNFSEYPRPINSKSIKQEYHADHAFGYDENDAGQAHVLAHPIARPVKDCNIRTITTSKKSIVHHQ